MPDGAIELLIDLGGPAKKLYTDEAVIAFQEFHCAWISVQRRRFIVIGTEQNSSMMGIRFRAGGAFPFLRFPVSELNDCVVDMEAVWGPRIHEIHEQLLEVETPEEKFRVLEQTLQGMIRGISQSDPICDGALAELRYAGEQFTIRDLARKLGVSERQLLRHFETRVGLGPKALARVFRLQNVLQQLAADRRGHWTEISAGAGYYDQSHFVHDFRDMTGLNPSRYLLDKRYELNYIPLP